MSEVKYVWRLCDRWAIAVWPSHHMRPLALGILPSATQHLANDCERIAIAGFIRGIHHKICRRVDLRHHFTACIRLQLWLKMRKQCVPKIDIWGYIVMQVKLPIDFDAKAYLDLNPDVKNAGVEAEQHYLDFGHAEGRVWKHISGTPSESDRIFHQNPKTKRSTLARHTTIWNWVRANNSKPGSRVVEIGSRCVQSDALWRNVVPQCDYLGIDIIDGKNVDIVGDAHRLSDYVELESVDLVLSFAVFEHLAMPWVVVEEISKVLKVGGHAVIETHFSFSEHEQPWHYFQFNSHALEILFCEELGFELIDSGLDTPIVGRFSYDAPAHLRGQSVKDLYCHSSIIVKKVKSVPISAFSWRDIAKRITSESSYPIESDLLYRQRKEEHGED